MTTVPFTAIYPDGPAGSLGTSAAGAGTGGADNPAYPGLPAGASPIHRDLAVSAAGTYAVWTPAAGKRVVLLGLVISSDTLMRVKLVDGDDVQGRRIVDASVPASGGVGVDLSPTPYVATAADQPLRIVTTAAGNVTVAAWGYEA